MSIKKVLNQRTVVETNLEYPIYISYQENDALDEIYIKYNKENYIKLEFRFPNKYVMNVFEHNGEINEYQLDHIIPREIWCDAINDFKDAVKTTLKGQK